MARYQFRQDNWSYGMSQDELGGGGTCYYASNVNLIEDKSKFTLSSGVNVEFSNATGTDELVAANIQSNTNQIWIGDQYTIYNYALASTKVLTNTTSTDRMCNCGVVYSDAGVAHGFIIHRGYVSKYTWDYTADTGVSTLTERHMSFTPTGNDQYKRPYYIEANYVYFGAGSDVKVFKNVAGTFTLDSIKLELGRGQYVVSISKIGDLFYVYASDGGSGFQYLWDGVSSAAERVIKWYDLPIQNAANFGNYDYVICKDATNKSYLYKVSGYSRQLIRQSGYFDSSANARYTFDGSYTNSIETIGESLIMASDSSENGVNGVYVHGKKHSSYPESIFKAFTDITGTVTCLYSSGTGGFALYAATKSGGTKRLYNWFKPFSPIYYSTGVGFIETNPIVGQFGEAQKKEAVKYRLGYRITNANGYVKVYYRKDGDTSYTLHQTISGVSYASETYPLGVNFQRIQFKFEIYSGSNSYTPTVYDFALEYEPIGNSLGN